MNDTFYNIVHEIVAKVHRDEKIARQKSAVTLARQKAEEEIARLRESEGVGKANKPSDIETTEALESKVRVETDGAIFDGGKVYLKGNPLSTTKEIICPHCRLPRLLYPTTGVGARPPPDPYREYCSKHPVINKPGVDVNGNPFATDKPNPKKKKHNVNTNNNTPGSSPPTTPDGSFKQHVPEKVSFPTVKCPNCPRYVVVTRVAQHLDRCLGLSGRGASRNRTPQDANTSAANGSTFDPNTGSKPTSALNGSSAPKRPLVDDDLSPVNHKKKKLTLKKSMGAKPAGPSKLKNGTTPDTIAAMEAAAAEAGSVDNNSKAFSDDEETKAELSGA